MGKENSDDSNNQLLNLDDNNKNIFVSHKLKDKARFDQKAAANNKKNETKIKRKSHLDLKV